MFARTIIREYNYLVSIKELACRDLDSDKITGENLIKILKGENINVLILLLKLADQKSQINTSRLQDIHDMLPSYNSS